MTTCMEGKQKVSNMRGAVAVSLEHDVRHALAARQVSLEHDVRHALAARQVQTAETSR